jgi:hypothetical protein
MADTFLLGLATPKTIASGDGITFNTGVIPQSAVQLAGGASAFATLSDVNGLFAAKSPKGSVRAVLAGAQPSTFGMTYSSGAKTLTAGSNGSINNFSIQGVTDFAAGDRVLVVFSNSGTPRTRNGIYVITQVGDGSTPVILTRAADFDTSAEIAAGSYVLVTDGTDKGAVYLLDTEGPFTLDTTELVWSKNAGPGAPTPGVATSISDTTNVNVRTDDATIHTNGDNKLAVVDGGIGETQLASGAVTEAKLASGAVTESKLASGSVATAAIQGQAVGTTEIADNAVTEAKLADGSVSRAKLAASVVALLPGAVADGSSTATTDATPTAITFAAAPNVPANTRAYVNVDVEGVLDSDATKTVALRGRGFVRRGGSGAAVVVGVNFDPIIGDAGGALLAASAALAPDGSSGNLKVMVTSVAATNAHWTCKVTRL